VHARRVEQKLRPLSEMVGRLSLRVLVPPYAPEVWRLRLPAHNLCVSLRRELATEESTPDKSAALPKPADPSGP
jgi:hypothetical protein